MNLSQESDEALEQTIRTAGTGSPAHAAAYAEVQRRHNARIVAHVFTPHWTLTSAFWVGVLILIFAAIAAWPVIREWFPNTDSGVIRGSFLTAEASPTPIPTPSTATPAP